MVEASLLSRKWQDKIASFQGVRKRALELFLYLGPSFEEVEKERVQAQAGSKAETYNKGK
jgi:hypothetical protein